MKKLTVVAIMVFAVAALLMVTATPSEAVHGASAELTCGQCHTMHSSQGGDNAPDMGGAAGSNILLRVSATKEVSDLCLSCHAEDGSAGNQSYNTGVWATYPPKVLRTSGAWTSVSTDFGTIGAGGDFSTVLADSGSGVYLPQGVDAGTDGTASLGYGHSINNANAITPPGATGGASFTTFSCTNCHDPHGVSATDAGINLYRNLKSGLGDNTTSWTADIAASYIGGVASTAAGSVNIGTAQTIWPVFKDAANQNTYFTGAAADDNMSKFCAQCHGLWHEDITGTNGAGGGSTDWSRHPVDLALDDGGAANQLSVNGATIVDWANYNVIAAGTKLPAMQSNAVASVYYADTAADKVFCLSCHFAHAGPNYDALRWAYQSSVGTGTQIGISLGSTVGCQQCHNRG